MKKVFALPLILLFALATSAANAMLAPPVGNEEINPELVYHGASTQDIERILFNPAETHFLVWNNSQLTLWDVAQNKAVKSQLIEKFKDIIWIPFTNKFAAITSSKLIVFDLNFNEVLQLSKDRIGGGDFMQLAQFNTQPFIVVSSYNRFSVIDEHGNILAKYDTGYSYNTLLSPNDKHLVNYSSDNRHHLYKIDNTGIHFVRSVSLDNATQGRSYQTVTVTNDEVWSYFSGGINRTKFSNGLSKAQLFKPWYSTYHTQLIQADHTFLTYTSGNYGSKKLYYARLNPDDNFSVIKYGEVPLKPFSDYEFALKARLLVLWNRGDFYLYDISSLFSNAPAVKEAAEPAPVVEPEPVVEPTPIVQPAVVEKPVVPLDIKIKASVTSGVAPLKVTFELDSSASEQVATTLSLIDEEQERFEGIPLGITKTFEKPGTYVAAFAFRSHEGKIVKDSIKIEVREESFEDYKQKMLGK